MRPAWSEPCLARPDPSPQRAPVGEVALAFTDVQGSTSLWEEHPDAMRVALVLHDELFRQVLAEHGGYEVKTEGDAFMVAFPAARPALAWCRDVQVALAELEWPAPIALRGGLLVRMGVHVGRPDCRPNPLTGRMDYFGPVVNRAARVASAAHGGQILLSGDAWERVSAQGGLGQVHVTPLGAVGLKGLRDKVPLVEALPDRFVGERRFPPPRGEDAPAPAAGHVVAGGLDATLRYVAEGLRARAQVRRLRGLPDAARRDLEATLACARAGNLDDEARRARFALLLDASLDHGALLAALARMADEARAADDRPLLARIRLEEARRLSDTGALDAARVCLDEAVGLFEASLDPDGMAGSFATLGGVLRRAGDHAGSEALYRRALGVVEASGSHRWRGEILVGLARISFSRGSADMDALAERARESARGGQPEEVGWAAFLLGSLRLLHGDVHTAVTLLEEACAAFQTVQEPDARGRATLVLATARWVTGARVEARELARGVCESAASRGIRVGEAAARVHLACFDAAEGQADDARAQLARARGLLEGLPLHDLHAEARHVETLLRAGEGDWSGAEGLVDGEQLRPFTVTASVIRKCVGERRGRGGSGAG